LAFDRNIEGIVTCSKCIRSSFFTFFIRQSQLLTVRNEDGEIGALTHSMLHRPSSCRELPNPRRLLLCRSLPLKYPHVPHPAFIIHPCHPPPFTPWTPNPPYFSCSKLSLTRFCFFVSHFWSSSPIYSTKFPVISTKHVSAHPHRHDFSLQHIHQSGPLPDHSLVIKAPTPGYLKLSRLIFPKKISF
jgi:hypothetical protein